MATRRKGGQSLGAKAIARLNDDLSYLQGCGSGCGGCRAPDRGVMPRLPALGALQGPGHVPLRLTAQQRHDQVLQPFTVPATLAVVHVVKPSGVK